MEVNEGRVPVVAFGDGHGCASLLVKAVWPHLGSGSELIFLGDAFDRSKEPDGDRKVLELLRELQDHPDYYGIAKVTVILGNHEQLLLDALAEHKPGPATKLWTFNGGNLDFLPVARKHKDWLRGLPLYVIRGDYLFVHAGVRAGIPLVQQDPDDLLWIRDPFLTKPHGLPYKVIHGHSFRPDFKVTKLGHRIGIDTGAYAGGPLTALAVDPWDCHGNDEQILMTLNDAEMTAQ